MKLFEIPYKKALVEQVKHSNALNALESALPAKLDFINEEKAKQRQDKMRSHRAYKEYFEQRTEDIQKIMVAINDDKNAFMDVIKRLEGQDLDIMEVETQLPSRRTRASMRRPTHGFKHLLAFASKVLDVKSKIIKFKNAMESKRETTTSQSQSQSQSDPLLALFSGLNMSRI